jgi:hypothetical protein
MATASKSYSRSRTQFTDLMWPANLTSVYDYLQMDIVKFVPIAQVTASSASNISNPSNPVTPSDITSGIISIVGGRINGGISNVQMTNTAKPEKTILLPVPENLNYTDALKWSEQPIGVLNKMLPGVVSGVMSGDAGGATNAIQSLAGGGKIGLLLKAVQDMGLNANAITQGMAGKVANPYTEQIFEGINMRNFELSWKLVPRSQSEQLKIHELIKQIRKYALPNYSGSLGVVEGTTSADTLSDRWLEVPYIFNLSWKKPGGSALKSIPKIKPCVLKNITVSYTPDNVWATHMVNKSDPYPVAYNINMSFSETEIITGKDVDNGY